MKIKTFRLFFANNIMHILPETRCYRFKSRILKLCGVVVGKNVRVCSSVKVIGNGILEIGDNTFIGPQTFIHVTSSVKIGKNCDISSKVTILNGSHEIDNNSDHIAGRGISEDVIIGDGCWVCTNAVILGSSMIGNRCLVAAGAITKGKYENYKILKGTIAKQYCFK